MREVSYRCIGTDGVKNEVKTLQEATDFISIHGGTYDIKYTQTVSLSEGYSRSGHRVGGKQGSRS